MVGRKEVCKSGTEIMIGRNSKENDLLTFTFANKKHIWLHVKNYPGSHVVLCTADPSKEELQTAANIAAKYSKARNLKKIDVTFCTVSDVTKPKYAAAGEVEITSFRQILAFPLML